MALNPTLRTPQQTGCFWVWSADQDDTNNPDYMARIDGRESFIVPVQNTLKGPGPTFTPRTDGDRATIMAAIMRAAPRSNIFTYIDSTILDDISDTQDGYQMADPFDRFPGPDFSGCIFSMGELLKYEAGPSIGQYVHPYSVDIRQTGARNKLLDAMRTEMLARKALGYTGVRTDNWRSTEIDSSSSPYPISLAQMFVYFGLLNDVLHSIGFYHLPNFGYTAMHYPTIMSDAQLAQLALADAVDFELSDNPTFFASKAAVDEWLRKAKLFVDNHCYPVLLPTTSYNPPGTYPAGYYQGILFYCGMAAALGDAFYSQPLFVDRLNTLDTLLATPKLLGTVTACGARSAADLVVQRGLTKKTVIINTVSRAVTYITIGPPMPTIQAASGRYQIVDGAIRPAGYRQITDLSGVVSLDATIVGANCVLLQAENAQVRWCDDGTNPTASTGMFIPVGGGQWYVGDLTRLKLIQAAAGAVLNCSYYFSG
jgi:hypothetical protein